MKYSVIVPVYNAERFLEKCLTSLASQTVDRSEYEVLMIDDGSTDASREICDRFAASPNFKYFYKNNGGPSSARNYGITVSEGDYLLFVDSDDWCEPDFLKTVDENVADYDFLIHGYLVEYPNDTLVKNPAPFSGKRDDARLFSDRITTLDGDGFFSAPWIGVFRRSVVTENRLVFDETLSFGEDTCFVYDYIIRIDSLVCIDKPLYHYNNLNESSLTNKFVEKRYPLCINRFAKREMLYGVFGNTKKAEVQFAELLTVEINNCIRNLFLKKDCEVKGAAAEIYEILTDGYVRRRYGKKLFSYRNGSGSLRLTVIYLKIARFLKSKALLRLFSKKCLRRLGKHHG